MALDRDRLIKLLNVTASEHDAEALSALRSANALLRKQRLSWADILARPRESAPAQQLFRAHRHRPQPNFRARTFHASRYQTGWERKTGPENWRRRKAGSLVLAFLKYLFFPIAVFAWLYGRAVRTARWWLKPVAMLVPILGGGAAGMIWACMLLSVAALVSIF